MTEEEEGATNVWLDGRAPAPENSGLASQAHHIIKGQRQYYDEVHVIKEQVPCMLTCICDFNLEQLSPCNLSLLSNQQAFSQPHSSSLMSVPDCSSCGYHLCYRAKLLYQQQVSRLQQVSVSQSCPMSYISQLPHRDCCLT